MDCEAERFVTLVAVFPDHAVPLATRNIMRSEDTVLYSISMRVAVEETATYLHLVDYLQEYVAHWVSETKRNNKQNCKDRVKGSGLDKNRNDVGVGGCVLCSHHFAHMVPVNEQPAGNEKRNNDVE